MTVTLAQQTLWFAGSLLLGAGFGLLFDVITVVGDLLHLGRVGRFLLDTAVFVICALLSFLYLLTFLSGELRAYPIAGMVLGALLEHLTIGSLRQKCSRALSHALRRARSARKNRRFQRRLGKKDENKREKDEKISKQNEITS